MKQKISKQTLPDSNSFQTKAVKSAQSMGKQIIPTLYKKALAETFEDMMILEKWLKEIASANKKQISLTLTSGEILEDLTKEDIKNIITSIRERAKIKSLFYIQEYLAKKVESAQKSGGILHLDDLKYEETSDLDLLLHDKDSFFDDIQTMIRNYSIKEVQQIIDKEIAERKMHFVDLLEWYKQLPYVMDLDRKIEECKTLVQQIRMKAYFEWRKDIDHKEERIIKFKLEQTEEFEKEKSALLQDKNTWSKELAIVYRLEQLKNYRKQFEHQWFVMLPSRQKIYDEILWEVLNGNSTLITWHTGTGKTVLAVKISKNLQEKYFENFIITQDLLQEIAANKEYITLLAAATGKTESQIQQILWLDKNTSIDNHHKQSLLRLIKSSQKHFPEEIKKTMEEIKNDPIKSKWFEILSKSLQYNPDFVEVLSGNSGMTVGEISAKLGLEWDGKWGTRTTTQMGKLLKAMSQGKLPVFDEINLVPTDTIMRTKHIFTLKPGESFSPQEGQWEIVDIKNPTVIATGNLWTKYERNKIDPAVLRLLGGIEATYFDRNETYDIAIISLMDKEGFITWVDPWFLSGDHAPLIKLIEALKHIEDNYMGKWSELVIDNKKDNRLKEAILDIGNFVKMFKNYGLDDKQIQLYTKTNIIKFITNTWYNVEDRKILITIFAQKWLITKKDIPAIIERNDSDLTEEILTKCMSGSSDALSTKTTGVSFIDPYELATLDPYGQRNFEKLPSTWKTRILAESIEHIREEIMTQDETLYKKDIEKAIDTIYQHAIEKENVPLDVDLMARVFFDLQNLGLEKLIKSFEKLDHFTTYHEAFLKKQEEHEHMLQQKSQLKKNAEDALKHEHYNDAISKLQDMLLLDPYDDNLPDIIEQVREQRIKKIKNLINKWKKEIYDEKYEQANTTFNTVLELDKTNTEVEEFLDIIKAQLTEKISSALQEADTFYAHKQFNEAKTKYQEVLRYDSKHPEATKKLNEINQQTFTIKIDWELKDIDLYLAQKDFLEAKKQAKHIIELVQQAKEDQQVTYDTAKLKQIFQDIHQRYRQHITTMMAQGEKHRSKHEEEKALEIFEQVKMLQESYTAIT